MKTLLFIGLLLTTTVQAARIDDFRLNARCSQWSMVAGDSQTASIHMNTALMALEPRVAGYEAGIAEGIIIGLVRDHKDMMPKLAKKFYMDLNCKAQLPKEI